MCVGTKENLNVSFNKNLPIKLTNTNTLMFLFAPLTERTKICSLIIIGLFLTIPKKLYSL